ncbi:capsid protein [Apis mellifera virus-10]|nr:capsid protein [Apis mellifera virus-10]QBX89299.1 capsid protein [Apis mellifera virus-10]
MFNPRRLKRYARKSGKSFGKYRKSFKRYTKRFAKTSQRGRRSGYRSKRSGGGYLKRIGGYASTAYSALRLAKTVYSLINPEMKYVDNNTINGSMTTTATQVNFITSIGQGSDVSQRNGNSVLLKYIKCTFNLQYNLAQGPTAVRITIVSTMSGGTPAALDIYETTSSGAATVLSPWKKNSAISYKVWYDRVHHIDQYRPQQIHRKDIRSRGHHHIKYQGASPTNTGPGNFYALVTVDRASVANYINMSQLYRIGYLDN